MVFKRIVVYGRLPLSIEKDFLNSEKGQNPQKNPRTKEPDFP